MECLLWLQRIQYDGHLYFDTFPINEDPVREAAANIRRCTRWWNQAAELEAKGLSNWQSDLIFKDFRSNGGTLKKRVLVVGAANLDRMVYVDQLPAVGATIMGQRYEEHPGGKGSNQAVAASLWGTQTQFVGCLGDDEAGTILREAMLSAGVNLDLLQTHPIGSGLALDFVDQAGRYQAVVISRANEYVTSDFLKPDPTFWKDIGLVVQQLEIPFDTVDAVGRMALNFDVPVLLNAAPAANIPQSWWDWINMLVINEVEASALTGLEIENTQDAEIAAKQLRKHCPNVLITLGERCPIEQCRVLITFKPIQYQS